MMFAWIAKAVIERCGWEQGEAVVRKAVRRYGEERGQRMAQRARANRHSLSMVNYLAYSEWRAAPGSMLQSMPVKNPDLQVLVERCPWNTAWEASQLKPYGCLYCKEIDEAVLRGFNPKLHIEVLSTQSGGEDNCEFIFQQARLDLPRSLKFAFRKSIFPGSRVVMPWDYHTAHLFYSMCQVIEAELGEKGARAMEAALTQFVEVYGEESASLIRRYQSMDFSQVPG
jgi:hypothetical protein